MVLYTPLLNLPLIEDTDNANTAVRVHTNASRNILDQAVLLTGAQQLSGKTLVAPAITGGGTWAGALAGTQAAAATDVLTLTATDAGGVGVVVTAFHNSASPAVNDALFRLNVTGRNSTPATVTYGRLQLFLGDATAASEDAYWQFSSMLAGTLSTVLTINPLGTEIRSGGLQVTAGNVGIGGAPSAAIPLVITTGATGWAGMRLSRNSISSYVAVADAGAVMTGTAAGDLSIFAGVGAMWFGTGGAAAPRMLIDANGKLFIGGSTSNSRMGLGLTIDQGPNDNEILAFKSTDIAHGMTNYVETSTYTSWGKAHATQGGLLAYHVTTGTYAFLSYAFQSVDDTAKAGTSNAAYVWDVYKNSPPTVTAPTANNNAYAWRSNGTNCALLDNEGDLHLNATSNINVWDDHDDPLMARAMRLSLLPPADPLRERFADLIERYREPIARSGLVTYNDDGIHYINVKRTAMFTLDAIYQLSQRLAEANARIAALEAARAA